MSDHANPHAASRRLKTLNALHRGLMRRDPPVDLLSRILDAATTLLPAPVCALWRSEARGIPETLRLEAFRGLAGRRAFPRTLPLAGSFSERAMLDRRSEAVYDLGRTTGRPEKAMASQRGLTSLLCVPIILEAADQVGALHCYTPAPHAFSPLEIETAEALALLIAGSWLRAGSRKQVQALKEELETRKQVDRAKEILMDGRNLTAGDAYRWIQKRSMDTRRSMREVAEAVILAEVSGRYSSIPHALDFSKKSPRK